MNSQKNTELEVKENNRGYKILEHKVRREEDRQNIRKWIPYKYMSYEDKMKLLDKEEIKSLHNQVYFNLIRILKTIQSY